MGPTGCGKTSLLNVLAARVSSGGSANSKLSGTITLNGTPRNDADFRKISAYVLQDDKLYPHLTVFETLLLAAHFYLGDDVSIESKYDVVDAVIAELGLEKTRNTVIGDERVRGVSGGERKRANVGVQLISDPAVLFLDEPTSGLDAFQAQAVMESMKAMSENGRLVISVIHQPRSSIFDMFDMLLLLSEGRTMYLGDSNAATSYFATQGFPCPKLFNPSDFFLDTLSPDNRDPEIEEITTNRIQKFGDVWLSSYQTEFDKLSDDCTSELPSPNNSQFTFKRILRNFQILGWRSWTEQSRELPTFFIKLGITIFFGLVLGGIYSNTQDNQQGISNRMGILFVLSINQGFNSVLGVLNSFPKEKVIVNRERAAGAYDSFSYILAKYFVELPLNLVPCIVYISIVYFMAHLNPDKFGITMLILMFEVAIGISLGLWISAAVDSPEAASALGTPAVIIALLFSGYYINLNSLPIVANGIPYLSFIRWTLEALLINEFTGETFKCNDAVGACKTTGEQVLNILSFGGHTIYYPLFGLGMLLIAFSVMALFTLYNSKISFISLGHRGRHLK